MKMKNQFDFNLALLYSVTTCANFLTSHLPNSSLHDLAYIVHDLAYIVSQTDVIIVSLSHFYCLIALFLNLAKFDLL